MVVYRGLILPYSEGKVGHFLNGAWPLDQGGGSGSAKYERNGCITWPSFSSTTTEAAISLGYSVKQLDSAAAAVMFKITARTAVPIRNFSYYPYEEEYLYKPNTRFVITGLHHITTIGT